MSALDNEKKFFSPERLFGATHKARIEACSPTTLRGLALALAQLLGDNPATYDIVAHAEKWEAERKGAPQ